MKMVDLAAAVLSGKPIDLGREVEVRLNTLAGLRRWRECSFDKQELGEGFVIQVEPNHRRTILTIYTPRKELRVYSGPKTRSILGVERTVEAINYLDRCIEENSNQSWLRNQSS